VAASNGRSASGTGRPTTSGRSVMVHFPVSGAEETVPTASTPGTAASRSRSARYIRQTSALVAKPFVLRSMATTEPGW